MTAQGDKSVCRRQILGVIAGLLASATVPMRGWAQDELDIRASGLGFPEGPILAPNGGVILSELGRGRVTHIAPDGRQTLVAATGGSPGGLAVGPGGALYVANLGKAGESVGACVQRIDPRTRQVTVVVDRCAGRPFGSLDDLVFDAAGGFYFTDLGVQGTLAQVALVPLYYFDGKEARPVSDPSFPTNGVGLSPDGARIYWTEYLTGRLYSRRVTAPGVLAQPEKPHGDCLYSHPAPVTYFDSLRVDAEGCVSVAVHDGTPTGKSGIMSFDPTGRPLSFARMPDNVTTSLALASAGAKQAYITLGKSGRLLAMPWPRYGQPSAFPLAPDYGF